VYACDSTYEYAYRLITDLAQASDEKEGQNDTAEKDAAEEAAKQEADEKEKGRIRTEAFEEGRKVAE
jgi:hypothetical protein